MRFRWGMFKCFRGSIESLTLASPKSNQVLTSLEFPVDQAMNLYFYDAFNTMNQRGFHTRFTMLVGKKRLRDEKGRHRNEQIANQ